MYFYNLYPKFFWFCMRSEEKVAKFSVSNARDSPRQYAIHEGIIRNIEMELRSFVRETINS